MFVTRLSAAVEGMGGGSRSGPGSDFWFMPLYARTASGVAVGPQEAMALTAVFACVRVLAQSFAIMPFQLFRNRPDGTTRTEDRSHWLYRLFARRPNRFQNPFEWRLMLQGHLALRGNAFCQITSNGRGEITDLLPLHPDRMAIEMVNDGQDYRYVYTDQANVKHYYTRGEIWHLRGLSDDGLMGLSPIEMGRESIGEGLAMQAYSARFFANDARPPGWIENPGFWKDEDTKRKWRDSWQRLHSGANRGKVAVLERGMKYHELGLKNTDAQLIEGRNLKTADIARLFNVPLHKIGDLSRATNNNIEHQSIEFWTDTMLPYAEAWEASIEYSLLGHGLPGGEELLEPEFDMDRMMRGDAQARAAYYASRTQWGSMKPNEVREREGDQPLPWLDYTMRPVNMVREDENGAVMLTASPAAASVEVEDSPDDDAEDQAEMEDSPDDGEDDSPDDQPANGSRARAATSRRENVALAGAAMAARWRSVISGNARRMARRLAAGQATAPDLLAEALGIAPEQAAQWLHSQPAGLAEDQYAEALTRLALEDTAP